MDLATILGLVIGLALIMLVMVMSGSLMMYWDFMSILIVIGGAICASLIGYPLKNFITGMLTGLNAVTGKVDSPESLIDSIEQLAQTARKSSILALEKVPVENEFLSKAVKLAVSGLDPEIIDGILAEEIVIMKDKVSLGKKVYGDLGENAPAFGMIGTVIGLVVIMANLTDPSKIGPGLAVALITTLYGALVANLVFMPISKKLKYRGDEMIKNLEMTKIGMAGLVSGQNPRMIRERLEAYLE